MADEPTTGITEIRREGPAAIVVLTGEVDLKHSPIIHQQLADLCEDQPASLILDLAEVTHMDSSGVGTLVEIYRRTQGYGGQLLLACVQDKVKAVFEITQLDQFFTMCDTVDEALQA